MLLASVPRLHQKWEPLTESAAASFEPAVTADGSPLPPAAVDADAEKQRSRSSLDPLAGRAGRHFVVGPAGVGLPDIGARREKDLRLSEEVPPLVEVEEDHFAAVSEPAPRASHAAG